MSIIRTQFHLKTNKSLGCFDLRVDHSLITDKMRILDAFREAFGPIILSFRSVDDD